MKIAALIAAFVLAGTLPAAARVVPVKDTGGLAAAVRAAKPGDEIVLAPGTYSLGSMLRVEAEGSPSHPIVVRGAQPGKVVIRSSAVVAFWVTGAYWHFSDLEVRGVCSDDSQCEHAFHVVGQADHFSLTGSRLIDFNAQVKVNADGDHETPDDGLIENNEIFDTRPRRTTNPVAKLDIDNVSRWVIRGNAIYDFHKAGGDEVSYGGYVKGGGEGALFERNLVICARKDEDGGARVGLSFGGGGMRPDLCRPHWNAETPCEPEVAGGVMRNNIVAECSDVGIYINSASDTKVLFNTLIRTKGVEFRFPAASGEAHGNLLQGTIRGRDGGTFEDTGNMMRIRSGPLEDLYKDANAGDLRLKGDQAVLLGKGGEDPRVPDDFCGRPRKAPLDMGALQASLGDCPTLR